MSKILGKIIREGKGILSTLSSSTNEVGHAVGDAVKEISNYANLLGKISVLESEIDDMYSMLGKIVVDFSNSEADVSDVVDVVSNINDKKSVLENLQIELNELSEDSLSWKDLGSCSDWSNFGNGENVGFGGCDCDCEDCKKERETDDESKEEKKNIDFKQFEHFDDVLKKIVEVMKERDTEK